MDLTENFEKTSDILFGRYGASQGIESSHPHDFNGIDYHLRFRTSESFGHFLEDLSLMYEVLEERQLRRTNPTIQRAYDEYQLLLKLSK